MNKTIFSLCAVIALSSALSAQSSRQERNTPKTLSPLVTGLHICGAISCGSDGNFYISEWSAERGGVYDAGGRLLRVIDGIGDPSGNVFDGEGNFYVSSYSHGRVWKIEPDKDGNLACGKKSVYASGFDVPAGLSWTDGALVVANRDAGEVVRVERNGRKIVLANGLPQPVSVLKMKDGATVISCLAGSPRILEADGTLSVLIPEITASGINIIADGADAFLFCVISGKSGGGTVERVTLGGNAKKRTARREEIASGFSTPIGIARLSDGRIIFNAWGQGAAYVIAP